MKKSSLITQTTLSACNGKDSHFIPQLQQVTEVLKDKPQTMLEVAKRIGIERANVCRYIFILKKERSIQLVKKARCPITGYRAGFYSTDTNRFIQQLELF